MQNRNRRRLIVLLVLVLFGAAVASYRSKTMAENERRFRERYG